MPKMSRHKGLLPLELADWCQVIKNKNSIGVPSVFLQRGVYGVPQQKESWECGVNSGARFASMLGQTLPNYQNFCKNSPNYKAGPFLLAGPNPERLQNYLRQQKRLAGSDIGQRCTDNFERQKHIIDKALSQGRPALVLFIRSAKDMEWLNIVGQHTYYNNNYIVLDASGRLHEIHGGPQELANQIFAGDECWVRAFKFISPYNTITCTNACSNKESALENFDADFYCFRYTDLQATFGHLPVAERFMALSNHFLQHGKQEGRQTHSC